MFRQSFRALTKAGKDFAQHPHKNNATPDPNAGGGATFIPYFIGAAAVVGLGVYNKDMIMGGGTSSKSSAQVKQAHEGAWGGQGARAAEAQAKGQQTHAQIQRRMTKSNK